MMEANSNNTDNIVDKPKKRIKRIIRRRKVKNNDSDDAKEIKENTKPTFIRKLLEKFIQTNYHNPIFGLYNSTQYTDEEMSQIMMERIKQRKIITFDMESEILKEFIMAVAFEEDEGQSGLDALEKIDEEMEDSEHSSIYTVSVNSSGRNTPTMEYLKEPPILKVEFPKDFKSSRKRMSLAMPSTSKPMLDFETSSTSKVSNAAKHDLQDRMKGFRRHSMDQKVSLDQLKALQQAATKTVYDASKVLRLEKAAKSASDSQKSFDRIQEAFLRKKRDQLLSSRNLTNQQFKRLQPLKEEKLIAARKEIVQKKQRDMNAWAPSSF